jgi:chorismate mutase
VARATPRWFGVTPPTGVVGLAAAALVLAIVLLAGGRWIAGLLVLGLALLLFAAFLEVARRKPDSPVVERAADAADSLLARAGFAASALRTQSSARREIVRRRGELVRLMAEREALLRELGAAAYAGDEGTSVRERIAAVDERAAALAAEANEIAEQARARVERAAVAVKPTEVVRPGDRD